MSTQNSVVAVYSTHTEADQAVKALQRGGVGMYKLSVAGKGNHSDEHTVGYSSTDDRMKHWKHWRKIGAFWRHFLGVLFRSAFLMIPGFGPILAEGPAVAWIVGALENAVVVGGRRISALGVGLYSSLQLGNS